MKDKIFTGLKQAFSHLGLGDAVLTAYAESLEASGIVTDENLDAVVKAQKASLEAIQKANDKRASDAKKDAQKAYDKLKAEMEAKLAEVNPQPEPEPNPNTDNEPNPENNGKGIPAWFTAYETKRNAELKELTESNKKLSEQLHEMEQESTKFKAEQAKAKRTAFIQSEAKRLGVPEWRYNEGFNIADDADDGAITEYLTKVANNVKTNMLPDNDAFPKFGGKKIEKSELDSLADKLLK